jgi:hypothetical protein
LTMIVQLLMMSCSFHQLVQPTIIDFL